LGRVADFSKKHLIEADPSNRPAPEFTNEDLKDEIDFYVKEQERMFERIPRKATGVPEPETQHTFEEVEQRIEQVRRAIEMTPEEFMAERKQRVRAAIDELHEMRKRAAGGQVDRLVAKQADVEACQAIMKDLQTLRYPSLGEALNKHIAEVVNESALKQTAFKEVPFPAGTPDEIKMFYEMTWPSILSDKVKAKLEKATNSSRVPDRNTREKVATKLTSLLQKQKVKVTPEVLAKRHAERAEGMSFQEEVDIRDRITGSLQQPIMGPEDDDKVVKAVAARRAKMNQQPMTAQDEATLREYLVNYRSSDANKPRQIAQDKLDALVNAWKDILPSLPAQPMVLNPDARTSLPKDKAEAFAQSLYDLAHSALDKEMLPKDLFLAKGQPTSVQEKMEVIRKAAEEYKRTSGM
jgi:hypothetical protein